jgi:hypothetical protein
MLENDPDADNIRLRDAVLKKDLSTVKALLDSFVDPHVLLKESGKTAYQLAHESKDNRLIDLFEINALHSSLQFNIKAAFKYFNLNAKENLSLVSDIQHQLYKLYNLRQGDLVPLISNISFSHGFFIYAMRDNNGKFHIIFKHYNHEKNRYDFYKLENSVDNPSHLIERPWDPIEGLDLRLAAISKTEEIEKILVHYDNFIKPTIHDQFSDPTQKDLIIKPDPSNTLNHEIHILHLSSGEYKMLLSINPENTSYIEVDAKDYREWQPYGEPAILLEKQAIKFLERIKYAEQKFMKQNAPLPIN